MATVEATSTNPVAMAVATMSDPRYRHFVGGAIGGMTAAIITSPLEVVKTRLQTKASRDSMARTVEHHRLTTSNVLRSILQHESIFGLWRGILPNLLGVVPARAAYFGCYAKLKSTLGDHGYAGTTANFTSAAAAGCLTASFLSPIFVIKTRMQLMPVHTISLPSVSTPSNVPVAVLPRFHSMHEVAIDMYRREGMRSFFKGLSASYWGVSEGAIQLALYEELKSRLGDDPSKPQLFVLAGVCKLVAAAATYPHEVVRTRLRDQRTPTDGSLPRYRSMFQALNVIYKSEGRRGLYGGMPAHLLKTVPNAAIMYVVLEMVVEQQPK